MATTTTKEQEKKRIISCDAYTNVPIVNEFHEHPRENSTHSLLLHLPNPTGLISINYIPFSICMQFPSICN